MIKIENDYRELPENEWWFNPVIKGIIQGFSIADKGTEFFDVSHRTVPYSDTVPITFNISVDQPGTYIYNNNQRQPKTLLAQSAGIYKGSVILEPGRNTVRVLNPETREESENVVYLEARELYGWIPAAVAMELLSISGGITILKSLFNIGAMPLEVLEEVYGRNICARLQPGQDEEEFRRMIATYYAAVALGDSVLAIRTAPFGFSNVQDVWTSLHHLEKFDSFYTRSKYMGSK